MNIQTYLILCSMFAYGMFTLQRPGFLLQGMRKTWRKFPKAIHEPLFDCGVCVSSIWGGSCFIYLYLVSQLPANLQNIAQAPVVLVGSAGILSFVDRAVKFFEKSYGYKPAPDPSKPKPKSFEYLMPYEYLRTRMIVNYVNDCFKAGRTMVEIGGIHKEWDDNIRYRSYTKQNPFTLSALNSLKPYRFDVLILGLYFNGDLKILQKAIAHAHTAIIEYSDDGISRQQVEWITEGLKAKLLVPEYDISVNDADNCVPGECGCVAKRKFMVIYNANPFRRELTPAEITSIGR